MGPNLRMPSGNGHTPTIPRKYRVCVELNMLAIATRPASSSRVLLASNFELTDTAPAAVVAVHVVFTLAIRGRDEFGVKPRAILVSHFQRELCATVGRYTKTKAQPARK